MSANPSPDSCGSDYLPTDMEPETSAVSVSEKCAVCGKPAFCYNYGVSQLFLKVFYLKSAPDIYWVSQIHVCTESGATRGMSGGN